MDNDVAVKEDAVGRVVRRSGMEMEEDFIVVGVVWFFVLPLILIYWWSTNNKSQRCGLLWLWVVVSFWVVLFPVRVINLPVMKFDSLHPLPRTRLATCNLQHTHTWENSTRSSFPPFL
jgi:hypothetical protein